MDNKIVLKEKESTHMNTKMFILLKLRDKNFLKGISTLIGAGLINFLIGAIYSVCQLVIYEISYVKRNNPNSTITIENETFYYPVEVIFQCIAAVISGILYKILGLQYTNLIGAGILFLGYLTLVLSRSFPADMLGMTLSGFGTGIIYYPATTYACDWFIENKGIVIGIIETMLSLGSFYFNFLGEKVINPTNKKSEDGKLYNKEIAGRFKTFMIYLILHLIIIYLLSFALIFKKNKDFINDINVGLLTGLKTENEEEIKLPSEEENKDLGEKKLKSIKKSINLKKEFKDFILMIKKAVKSKKLLLFGLIGILQAPIPSMTFALYREIGEHKNINQTYLTSIGPIYFIFECVGGFAFGVLCDYVSKKNLILFINGTNALIGYIYFLCFKSNVTFFLATNIISFTTGGYYSVSDCFLMDVFGIDIFIELISYINICVSIIIIALTPLSYTIEKSDAGYWAIFGILSTINLIGFILSFFINENAFEFNIDYSKEEEKKITGDVPEQNDQII